MDAFYRRDRWVPQVDSRIMLALVQAQNNITVDTARQFVFIRHREEKKTLCPQRYSLPTQDDRDNFGLADKNMFISPTTVLSRCYFSPVSEAKPLKVCYHLVRWSFLLVNWFCGLKATRLLSILQPKKPDRTWCIRAHIFSLILSKYRKGWARKASFEGGVWNPPWRKNRAFHLTLSPSPLLTKAADRRVEINSMEPPDESQKERERGKTEELYEDFTRRKSKNNQWLLAGLPPKSLETHDTVWKCGKPGGR